MLGGYQQVFFMPKKNIFKMLGWFPPAFFSSKKDIFLKCLGVIHQPFF
jgi:hypothetical protein